MKRSRTSMACIALGHPLGCTGAKLTTQLSMKCRSGSPLGFVSMCIGFGMGAAAILERETINHRRERHAKEKLFKGGEFLITMPCLKGLYL